MTPRLRSCDNPDCRICRWRDEEHPDSGHPAEEETFAQAALGIAAIVLLAIVAFVLIPVLT